jgi:autotransporter-associated beta strand protein
MGAEVGGCDPAAEHDFEALLNVSMREPPHASRRHGDQVSTLRHGHPQRLLTTGTRRGFVPEFARFVPSAPDSSLVNPDSSLFGLLRLKISHGRLGFAGQGVSAMHRFRVLLAIVFATAGIPSMARFSRSLRAFRRVLTVLAGACVLLPTMLHAADVYYDVDPATTPIDGGAANWSDANWKAVAGGTTGSTWAANDTAIFDTIIGSPSTTTITLAGSQPATGVTFNGSGYTLTGGTLALSGVGGDNWITMNASGTITSALTQLRFKGLSEATISGGAAIGGNRIVLGDGGGTTVTVRQTAGVITTSDYMMVGGNNVANSQGSYIIDGGSLTVSQGAYLGWGHASSSGTITQNGGTVTIFGQGLQLGIQGGSGSYVLNGGTLESFFGNDSAAGSFTFGGGTFKAVTNFTASAPRVASTTIASGANAKIDTNGTTVVWSNDLTGAQAAGLTKSGEGTLELSGSNSYTGATTVERGILVLGSSSAIGNGTETLTVTRTDDLSFLFNKTSLDLRGVSLTNPIVFTERNPGVGEAGALQNTTAGSTSVLSGAVTFAGDNYGGGDGNIRFDGVVSGGVSLSGYTLYKQGAGTWTFANENNTFSGFYYQIGGTTEVTKLANINEASSLGQPGTTTANQVRFGFGGTGGGRILYTGSSASTSDRAFVLQGTQTAASNRIDASGVNPAATLTLTGNVTAGSGYTFALGGTNAGVNVYAGTIGNGTNLSLLKDGSTTWRLTGSNTYTGNTTIAGGRFEVNGSIGNGAVTVQNGAALGGSGSIGGAVAVQSGGTLGPGNSIASLATGTATFASSATFAYEVDSSLLGSLSTAADLLVVSGNLNLDPGNGTLLSFTDLDLTPQPFVNDTTIFALINYSGAWNGGLFNYGGTALADGSQFKVGSQWWEIDYNRTSSTGLDNFTGDYLANSSFVTVTAVVPEPSTCAMAIAGLACGGYLVRRRRKRA